MEAELLNSCHFKLGILQIYSLSLYPNLMRRNPRSQSDVVQVGTLACQLGDHCVQLLCVCLAEHPDLHGRSVRKRDALRKNLTPDSIHTGKTSAPMLPSVPSVPQGGASLPLSVRADPPTSASNEQAPLLGEKPRRRKELGERDNVFWQRRSNQFLRVRWWRASLLHLVT